MANLCIIPARGGSKRIPRKNIKLFLGKPIISYSIELALSSELFDEVLVSTEDHEIKEIAIKYGAKVPFLRSFKNADDFATTFDVIEEVIDYYHYKGLSFDKICCIYPCAPLIQKNVFTDCFHLLNTKDLVSAFPVAEYSTPIQRALKFSNGLLTMLDSSHMKTRSQDLQKFYFDAGQFYWMNTKYILNNRNIFSQNSSGIVIDNLFVQDIDNQDDWKIAEIKYKLLYNLL